MEVNDHQYVTGKEFEDMTLEQLSELCVQKFELPAHQTMGKDFIKFVISKVVENGSAMEELLSTNRESVLSLAAFFNQAIPASGWQFGENEKKTTDLALPTSFVAKSARTEHGILASMFGSFVRKVFEGHPQFNLIEEELSELLTIINPNPRRISSQKPQLPKAQLNEADEATNYRSLKMLEGTPVVIPESSESERETQILAVANVTQISDVFDVDDVAEMPPRRSSRDRGVKQTSPDISKRESKRRRSTSKKENSTIDKSSNVEKPPKKRPGRKPKNMVAPEEKMKPEQTASINIRVDRQSETHSQVPQASDIDNILNDDETLVISEVDTLESKDGSQITEGRKIKSAGQTESKDDFDDSETAVSEDESGYYKLLLDELPADISKEFKSLVAAVGLKEAAAWLSEKISID